MFERAPLCLFGFLACVRARADVYVCVPARTRAHTRAHTHTHTQHSETKHTIIVRYCAWLGCFVACRLGHGLLEFFCVCWGKSYRYTHKHSTHAHDTNNTQHTTPHDSTTRHSTAPHRATAPTSTHSTHVGKLHMACTTRPTRHDTAHTALLPHPNTRMKGNSTPHRTTPHLLNTNTHNTTP